MSTLAITTVLEARSAANERLISHLPDRYAAGIPEYDANMHGWRIPVWLSYPQLEPLGPVGELVVDEASGSVLAATPVEEMKKRALQLYDQHREQIAVSLI